VLGEDNLCQVGPKFCVIVTVQLGTKGNYPFLSSLRKVSIVTTQHNGGCLRTIPTFSVLCWKRRANLKGCDSDIVLLTCEERSIAKNVQ
jgi:hypothetical protein